jgi:uncharacterized OB-fold protein
VRAAKPRLGVGGQGGRRALRAKLEHVSLLYVEQVLHAPLTIAFDYTRSLGPVLGRFMTGLAQRRILGSRGSDGRVHAPAVEFDPVTHEALTELVEVSTVGTVVTWTWQPAPIDGQPLTHPFAWALIRLDGADTPMLHAVDAGTPSAMSTGMRVRVRWAGEPVGHIRDIVCFEPGDADPSGTPEKAQASVTMVTTPIELRYEHHVSPEESRYLRGLAEGRVLGQRCPRCTKVYVPPRGACPTCGVPTTDEVELPDKGTITTFCVVNVPFAGQRVKPPYVAAQVLLDGADIPLQHLILGCPADEVRMGMRVEAVWRPREQWGTTPENIDHFTPSAEPDAPFESYAHHL